MPVYGPEMITPRMITPLPIAVRPASSPAISTRTDPLNDCSGPLVLGLPFGSIRTPRLFFGAAAAFRYGAVRWERANMESRALGAIR